MVSSKFILNLDIPGGEYYATGRYPGGNVIQYQCKFDPLQLNRLVCTGWFAPFKVGVYTQLFRSDSNQMVYSNVLFYQGLIATPTGMSCEVEPQWNGATLDHQLGQGCFAISCFQNGSVFFGSNNTCEKPWPFEWDFIHPLSTPNN
ncbi:MAG: hypothetical protein C0401_07285 [Anaerolinea sp.]|nr:hypothetical protein [Anaerolinea sp.]